MDDDKNIHGKIRLEHVISFADAIFAFLITFMAISIQIPDLLIIIIIIIISHKQS